MKPMNAFFSRHSSTHQGTTAQVFSAKVSEEKTPTPILVTLHNDLHSSCMHMTVTQAHELCAAIKAALHWHIEAYAPDPVPDTVKPGTVIDEWSSLAAIDVTEEEESYMSSLQIEADKKAVSHE